MWNLIFFEFYNLDLSKFLKWGDEIELSSHTVWGGVGLGEL